MAWLTPTIELTKGQAWTPGKTAMQCHANIAFMNSDAVLPNIEPIMMVRRRIGLAAFWYALLHILAYLGLDLCIEAGTVTGALAGLWRDVTDRIYITLGMSAFVLLIPLAITSFNRMQRWLGARRWQGLHRIVYPLAILAVLHHGFMVKGFQLAPWIHGAILAALLAYRLVGIKARKTPHPSASKS